MLEKIGLPPKPSLRGNNWVVDASNCQGCSSQFTFINRKHHCRRCGGIFCNSCTQQRMVLRGQGDSPVRICEPCKKLEEAARFELRQGRRAGRGTSKSTPRCEDEVLNQILGHDGEQSFSSGNHSTNSTISHSQRSVGGASSSSTMGHANEVVGDTQKIIPNDDANNLGVEVGSTSPDDLRQKALEEKKKYKILKGDGKPEEALRAFKRGKELERQADAVEIHLRKIRKKNSSSVNMSDVLNRDISLEPGKKTKSLSHMHKEKHDVTAELRELGWSDLDLRDEDRKSANLSLEGELTSIIGDIHPKTSEEKGSSIDKTQVVALKKKALSLKREGKLAEAKEELKRAKVLEKQLEEQELLAGAEDSDDELSALICGMDNNEEGSLNFHDHDHNFDFDNLLRMSDNLDGNFEVTDNDMLDPEIAGALKSLGWTEDSNNSENIASEPRPIDAEALLSEIQSLKREALKQKREGNTEEAMAYLKKAKLLERELNSSGSQENNTMAQKYSAASKGVSSHIAGKGSEFIEVGEGNINSMDVDGAPKSRLMIQRELLNLKKKALALRREGKVNEAEEELRKGAALEHQLEKMDKAQNLQGSQLKNGGSVPHSAHKLPDIHKDLPLGEGREEQVSDRDLSDPTYLLILKDMGWNDDDDDDDDEPPTSSTKPSKKDGDQSVLVNDVSLSQHSTNMLAAAPKRSKFEIQRELLGLKRKALALRREGKVEEVEEVLKMAKEQESKLAEMEAPNKEQQVEALSKDKVFNPLVVSAVEEGSLEAVTEEDIHDPRLNSILNTLGWKDEESEAGSTEEVPVKKAASSSVLDSSSGVFSEASRSKRAIQKELLAVKRKALALKRKGEVEEAEEVLRMAKHLEAQMEDMDNQNKEFPLNVSNLEKPGFPASTDLYGKHGSPGGAMGVEDGSRSLVLGSLSKEASPSNETVGHNTSAKHSMHSSGLFTGDSGSSSEIFAQKQREKSMIGSANLTQAAPPIRSDSSSSLNQEKGYKSNVTINQREEFAAAHEKPSTNKAAADQDLAAKNNVTHHQEILAHKKKALALKREGRLAEAREELRQAKLLEKSLENNMQLKTASNMPSNVSNVEQMKDSSNIAVKPSIAGQKKDLSNIAVKPLSSRDRFKLQQESLGHKRQALKLRREGRMEEAEAEFEKAKALEIQLEEQGAQDSDAVDDVTVEDFLDPQLLSALKAVGLGDVGVVSKSPEKQETNKPTVAKTENVNEERIQLEERIKAEKVKAVNLKRSGKQAEALDALRQAKLYEKKLNSLTSR